MDTHAIVNHTNIFVNRHEPLGPNPDYWLRKAFEL